MSVVQERELGENEDGVSSVSTDSEQFLTFIMAEEEYGVDILCVQEIRGWDGATPIPKSPPHVKGVINLRGTIVPLVDLRQRFGLEAVEYSDITVVIVLKIEGKDKNDRVMGIVVDAVSDVYTLKNEDMKDPPDLGEQVNTSYIKGLVNIEGKMVILLVIDELLDMEDVGDFSMVSHKLLEDVVKDDDKK